MILLTSSDAQNTTTVDIVGGGGGGGGTSELQVNCVATHVGRVTDENGNPMSSGQRSIPIQ